MIQKRWELCDENHLLAKQIAVELGITPVTAQILINRGISTIEEAQRFFDFDLNNLWDPFLFSDMERAVERVLTTISTRERVVIFGDYDVDGITGTSLLWRVFRKVGVNVDYYIPDRSEGYGMNLQAVERLAQGGYTLIVTVDNGISCYVEVERANLRGIDVIITDHHEPPEMIPPALAVINPKMAESGYPFSYLAGVGVGFKFCQALAKRLGATALAQYILEQLDLVTLGTIADIVPLVGENRLIAAQGLMQLQKTRNIGIQALINVAELQGREITAGHIGFMLGPRINAIGRMDNPTLGVELFTTEEPDRAQALAQKLDQANRKRQMLEETIVKSAIDQIEASRMNEEYGLVLASEDWHHGIIGIAASKLVERFYRPTILIAIHEGVGKGSARSIRGLNLYAALNHCKEYLIGFGGHDMAAGLSIAPEQIGPFTRAFQQYVEAVLKPEDLIPYLRVDSKIAVEDMNFELLGELERLEPHGPGNPRPVLQVTHVQHQHSIVGSTGGHLKLQIINERQRIGGIAFGMAGRSKELQENPYIDVAFNLERNVWQNRESLQMMVTDLRSAELSFVERLYKLAEGEQPAAVVTLDAQQVSWREEITDQETILDLLDQHFAYRSDELALVGVNHLLAGDNVLTLSDGSAGDWRIMLTYSAYVALKCLKCTCIFYPERVLLETEFRRLKRLYTLLGVRVHVAHGSLSSSEETILREALERGDIDILFTTPAYFSAHLEKFKLLRERIGLCIVKEAQQLHEVYHTYTLGYEGFDTLWQELGKPQLFMLTVSLEDQMVEKWMARLQIQQVIGTPQVRANLCVQDGRNEPDKLSYLQQFICEGEKTLIIVDSPSDSVDVATRLRKALNGMKEEILYSHEGLPVEMHEEVLARLARGESSIVVLSAGSVGELRIPDIRHVVFYHLGLHYNEFLRLSRLAGLDGKKSTIHLLYNTADLSTAEKMLESSAPDRNFLVKVYLLLEKLAGQEGKITLTPQGFVARLGLSAGEVRAVENSLWILEELQLIELAELREQWGIRLLPKPKQKLDLSSSIRYNEGIVARKFFAAFCKVAEQETPDELLERIIRPGFRTIVKGVDRDELS